MMTRLEIKQLTDSELRTLASYIRAEVRRRKRIERVNAEWTCNEGLEACLEASLKENKS